MSSQPNFPPSLQGFPKKKLFANHNLIQCVQLPLRGSKLKVHEKEKMFVRADMTEVYHTQDLTCWNVSIFSRC